MHHEEVAPGKSTTSVKLTDYLSVLFKRSRMIAAVTAAVSLASIVYSLTLSNIYTAKALVLPSQEEKGFASTMLSQLGGLANLAAGAVGPSSSADLYVTLLKSETVRDPIIDRFRLMEAYGHKYRADTYLTLDQTVSIGLGKKDGIISINVDDKDPRRAAEIANAYVDELKKLTVRLNTSGAGNTRSFMEGRLAAAKTDLARAEEALRVFQAKNKAVQVTDQAKAAIEGFSHLRAQLVIKEAELATLRQRFTDSSQEVKSLSATIGNLRRQVAAMEEGGGKGVIPQFGSMPQLGQEYVRLMREFKIQESLVELLTKQYEMAKLSEAKDISPLQLLQQARIPEKKSKPSRSRIVIKATVMALFAAILLAFGVENVALMPAENRERWKALIRQIPLVGRYAG
jgi:uncharacterized protein involved in exopolysaccharide biosynthesis